jgi:hypothetical protein
VRCLESERLFGVPYARLFPLVRPRPGDYSLRVQTARGCGVLRSVFAREAQVELDAGPKGKVTFFRPSEVWV